MRPYIAIASPSAVGWPAVPLEHADHVVGADLARVDRDHDAEDVAPVRADPGQVDPAAGERAERPVVGRGADAPALLVGDVGQRGPVLPAQQGDQPEDQVGVRAGVRDDDVGPLAAVLAEPDVDHVEGVADGAGHDLGADPGSLVIDHV
jgi:hypothetical protein